MAARSSSRHELVFNVHKYRVSYTDGKISVRIKIGITFFFRFHRRPIQLVVFVPVGLSLLCNIVCSSWLSKFLLTPCLMKNVN